MLYFILLFNYYLCMVPYSCFNIVNLISVFVLLFWFVSCYCLLIIACCLSLYYTGSKADPHFMCLYYLYYFIADHLGSKLDDYVSKLPVHVHVLRTGERIGLIRARLKGRDLLFHFILIIDYI